MTPQALERRTKRESVRKRERGDSDSALKGKETDAARQG